MRLLAVLLAALALCIGLTGCISADRGWPASTPQAEEEAANRV